LRSLLGIEDFGAEIEVVRNATTTTATPVAGTSSPITLPARQDEEEPSIDLFRETVEEEPEISVSFAPTQSRSAISSPVFEEHLH
jgi:hypothetical protein